VKPHDCGTHGTRLIPRIHLKNMKKSLRAWLPYVANNRRKVRQVTWRKSWLKFNYRKQVNPTRYSGVARQRHKKQMQKEAWEKAV
jgi:hypothetical protein